jgi:DNA polymerase-3 subunit gamma/tau
MRAESSGTTGFRATALRYRPQVFAELIGQEHVSLTLSNAITGGRIAHAFLFSGPRGVGKTSAARILAKSLNCEQGPTPSPCGVCANCTEITEGRSLDVYEIDGASNRGIEQIRDLKESVRFVPVRGRYKIYIIDEVHMLTNEAFNALLKTLEEPPASVIFIFATTEAAKVKLTIRSRCQQYSFHRISARGIQERLRSIAADDGLAADEDALFMIASAADGSMRDAESLFDQMANYALGAQNEKMRITAKHVSEMLGTIDASVYFDFLTYLLEGDCAELLERIARMDGEGVDFIVFAQGLAETLRNLILLASGASADSLELSPEDFAELQNFIDPTSADGFSLDDIVCLLRLLADTLAELHDARNPRRVFELALFRLVKFRDMVRPEEILRRLEGLELRLRGCSADSPQAGRAPGNAAHAGDMRPFGHRAGVQGEPNTAGRNEAAVRPAMPSPAMPRPEMPRPMPVEVTSDRPVPAAKMPQPPAPHSAGQVPRPPQAPQAPRPPEAPGQSQTLRIAPGESAPGEGASGERAPEMSAEMPGMDMLALVREFSGQVNRTNPFLSRVLNEVVEAEIVNGTLRLWLLPKSRYHRDSIEMSYSEEIAAFFSAKVRAPLRLECRFTDEGGYDAARARADHHAPRAEKAAFSHTAPADEGHFAAPDHSEAVVQAGQGAHAASLPENVKKAFGGEDVSDEEWKTPLWPAGDGSANGAGN